MGAIKFIITLPFRLLALAIIVPIKTVLGVVRFSIKSAYVTTRAALRSSLIAFAAGLGLGWFFTSTPTGRQLVDQVRELLGQPSGPVDDEQLTAQVRTELASNAHTWHLPQPEVSVAEGIVTLTGSVPHDTGRADLEMAAASVRGVVSVINSVTVDGPAASAPAASHAQDQGEPDQASTGQASTDGGGQDGAEQAEEVSA